MRIIANKENNMTFLNYCYGYYSIGKNKNIHPMGNFLCEEKFFEGRKKLNSRFCRLFKHLKERKTIFSGFTAG